MHLLRGIKFNYIQLFWCSLNTLLPFWYSNNFCKQKITFLPLQMLVMRIFFSLKQFNSKFHIYTSDNFAISWFLIILIPSFFRKSTDIVFYKQDFLGVVKIKISYIVISQYISITFSLIMKNKIYSHFINYFKSKGKKYILTKIWAVTCIHVHCLGW